MKAATRRADVVVIGAGYSGLSAGKLLRAAGVDVLVLEARDRVGGRVYTVENPKCKYVDLGAGYIGTTQNRLLRIAKEYNIKLFKVKAEGTELYHEYGKSKRYPVNELVPTKSIIHELDLCSTLNVLDELGEEIPVDAPWDAPHAECWDRMTAQEYFDKAIWTSDCKRYMKTLVNSVLTAEPYEVSLLYLLWYVKLGGGIDKITSNECGAQEMKFIGGAQQVPNLIANELGIGDKVLLNRAVVKIEQNPDGAKVTDSNGDVFECNYVIMAIPPTVQRRIQYSPPLTPIRNQYIQRCPMGSCIKTILYYDKEHWINNGDSGISSADTTDPACPIITTVPDTKDDGRFPSIMGFITSANARQVAELTKEERRDKIAAQYATMFGIPEMAKPVHYEEYNWLGDEWSGGAYTAVMAPGGLTEFHKGIREPFGRIYYAGTETATQWPGYMEGAIQAGERAAREIMFELGQIKKSEIWQEEPESEEYPCVENSFSFMEKHAPSVPVFLKFLGLGGLLTTVSLGFLIKHAKIEMPNIHGWTKMLPWQ